MKRMSKPRQLLVNELKKRKVQYFCIDSMKELRYLLFLHKNQKRLKRKKPKFRRYDVCMTGEVASAVPPACMTGEVASAGHHAFGHTVIVDNCIPCYHIGLRTGEFQVTGIYDEVTKTTVSTSERYGATVYVKKGDGILTSPQENLEFICRL